MNELELIADLRKIAGKHSLGLNDDCAVFGSEKEKFCITKDVLSSDIHFFADDAPFNLARKAIRVNLSDLAAMGAKPFGIMLGACLPRGTSADWLQEFNRGIAADIAEFGFELLGGDTVFHDAPLVLSVTAIGTCKTPLLRSTAKAGDNIFVSGKIGAGWLGLRDKKLGKKTNFAKAYDLPKPELALGQKLHGVATACMDISDGLLLDLSRLCKASNVGAELDSNSIPLADSSADFMAQISGGDDYKLLFTSTQESIEGCYKIGKITASQELKLDGEIVQAKGYEHKA
jgi:thiamine-monophosphate kinase